MASKKELGTPITRAQALEIVAHDNNFSDWNRYRARLERMAMPHLPLCTVLSGRPGVGKSWLLRRYAEQQIAQGLRPLWLMPYKADRDPVYADLARGQPVITLTVPACRGADAIGPWLQQMQQELLMLQQELLAPRVRSRGTMVQICSPRTYLNVPDAPNSGLTMILACLEQILVPSNWQPDVILVDEAQSWGLAHAPTIRRRLSKLSATGELVIAEQAFEAKLFARDDNHHLLEVTRCKGASPVVRCIARGPQVPSGEINKWIKLGQV